ncbi:response regulator transcription factor, partial [Streptomyces lavendulae]|uniref:response regulator transcription factor n=1 Tax=Streptomyces lavendulae TaxID=1914 RepID=UPI0036968D62
GGERLVQLRDVPPVQPVRGVGQQQVPPALPAAVRALAAAHTAAAAAPVWASRLTEREADVLRLMASGLSNHEISEHLGVGPQTVKTHVAGVLAKTGSRDRTQAVIAAYEGGFIMRKG